MKQPISKRIVSISNKKKKPVKKHSKPQYGTSKLEDKFAKEFLDRLGYKYTRQYKAKDIGRFYDFAITQQNGMLVLIEVDGDYW